MHETPTDETPVLDLGASNAPEEACDSIEDTASATEESASSDPEPTTDSGTKEYTVLSRERRTGRNYTISEAGFRDWFYTQEAKRNLEDGYGTTRNDPTSLPDNDQHSPSQLLGCHRWREYAANGAPREKRLPYGIFQFGHNTEELLEDFLRDEILGAGEFIQNSIHVTVPDDDITISGSTDPVVCDKRGEPLLLTECKTAKNLHHIRRKDEPKQDHKAQVHAYMKGLEHEYDLDEPPTAVVVYFSRERLVEMEAFFVDFDPNFWADVREWAVENTTHRDNEETLAPAVDPDGDFAYQCSYCDYAERCGNYRPGPHPWENYSPNEYDGEVFPPEGVDEDEWESQGPDFDYWYDTEMSMHLQNTHEDQPADGFLPMMAYNEAAVVEHLLSNPGVKLTPTLAHLYPDLIADGTEPDEHFFKRYGSVPQTGVHDFHCPACDNQFDWDAFDWDGDVTDAPRCPTCEANNDIYVTLRGPSPDAQ